MVTEDDVQREAVEVPGAAPSPMDEQIGEEQEPRPVSRLVFPVAGYGLLLDQASSMEFLESQTPFYIPSNHPLFRGLINRRGSLVPVFELRLLFDEPDVTGAADRVLVLGGGDDAFGIVLDATPYRVSVFEEQRASPPVKLVQVFGEHLGECYQRDNETFTRVALADFLYDLVRDGEPQA